MKHCVLSLIHDDFSAMFAGKNIDLTRIILKAIRQFILDPRPLFKKKKTTISSVDSLKPDRSLHVDVAVVGFLREFDRRQRENGAP